ncbi:40s ribosomal protein s15 [Lentinula edodes]|uniref:40s ribosomal protein s15 n=1 Tax=Lentinula edodes TaxID=5353 RepID=A0A1Q3ES08_LENED|nr:40s ribosomal protein s15 [Lentinula edodes]
MADVTDPAVAAEMKKKRTFRTFSYRGVELEKLLDMNNEDFVELVHARARRRFQRGLKRRPMGLIKKLRKAKKEAPPNEKPAVVKTHLRDMIVVPEMIGSVVGIYNGKVFNSVEIKPEMTGHYLGEFSVSYRPVKHGRPGIGATHSAVPLFMTILTEPTSHPPNEYRSRAPEFYGFVAWTSTSFLFVVYVLWALLPDEYIVRAGVEWYPNREWALLLPAWSMVVVLLTYFTYMALTIYGTPAFDEPSAVTEPSFLSDMQRIADCILLNLNSLGFHGKLLNVVSLYRNMITITIMQKITNICDSGPHHLLHQSHPMNIHSHSGQWDEAYIPQPEFSTLRSITNTAMSH